MFDLGWSELLVIGVVALIVVGPKDLPIMFRRMGQFTGRARAMAREFTSAMNAAADEAGVREMSKDLRKVADPRQMGLDAINEAADDLSDLEDVTRPARSAKPRKPTGPANRQDRGRAAGEAPVQEAAEKQARDAEHATGELPPTDSKNA